MAWPSPRRPSTTSTTSSGSRCSRGRAASSTAPTRWRGRSTCCGSSRRRTRSGAPRSAAAASTPTTRRSTPTSAATPFASGSTGCGASRTASATGAPARSRASTRCSTSRWATSSFLRFDAEGLRSEAAPDAGLPISGAQSFDLPRERSYQSPFDFSEQDVTRLRLHWETLLGGSWTIRNRAYWTELDWQSEGTLLNGVFPFFPGPDGLFVARTLVPLDDDQTLAGRRVRGRSSAARSTTGCSASRRRSAATSSPSTPASSRSSTCSTRSRPRPRGRPPFPASARRATPSGGSWRRT